MFATRRRRSGSFSGMNADAIFRYPAALKVDRTLLKLCRGGTRLFRFVKYRYRGLSRRAVAGTSGHFPECSASASAKANCIRCLWLFPI